MKIIGQQPPKTPEMNSGKVREQESAPRQVKGRSTEVPVLSRPQTSLTMTRVKEAIGNTPDVSTEKVAALRRQIANGEYKVDTDTLANNMINAAIREDLEKE